MRLSKKSQTKGIALNIKDRTFYAEATVAPYLATILQPNGRVYLSINTENSTFGRKMVKGTIAALSATPNRKNNYTLEITLAADNNAPFFVHGLSGTAFYYAAY